MVLKEPTAQTQLLFLKALEKLTQATTCHSEQSEEYCIYPKVEILHAAQPDR